MTKQTWLLVSVQPQQEDALFDWLLNQCVAANKALKVVVVLPQLSPRLFSWFQHEYQHDVNAEQVADEKQARQHWQERAQQLGVAFSITVCFGKMFYAAIQQAQQSAVELIIKQASDIKQQNNVFFQSTEWHLLRKSPIPVLLYRSHQTLPFKNVMVSMDLDTEIENAQYQVSELNQSLLSWGLEMHSSRPLSLVHAWQAEVEALVRHWHTNQNDAAIIALNERLFYEHKAALNKELEAQKLTADDVKLYLPKGEPAESIAATVAAQNVDLLVMGSLAREGVPGLFIGNTAEDLLEQVNCSVLTLKPNNFKSPIPPAPSKTET